MSIANPRCVELRYFLASVEFEIMLPCQLGVVLAFFQYI